MGVICYVFELNSLRSFRIRSKFLLKSLIIPKMMKLTGNCFDLVWVDRVRVTCSVHKVFLSALLKVVIPFLQGERATGYGVALLMTLFGKYSRCPMLQHIAPELK